MLRPDETLTQKERDVLLVQLNENQRKFVHEFLKRGKRTAFANVLAKEKASVLSDGNTEAVSDHFELIDYLDAGPNWQRNPQLFCECSKPLRYQYVVHNHETGEIKKFGITHFQEHTGISPQLAREILKGIERIDYELDELLYKISYGWSLADVGLEDIPTGVEVPGDIQSQLDLNLPLLDRQIARLKGKVAAFWKERKRQRVEEHLREEATLRERRQVEYSKQKELVAERLKGSLPKLGVGTQLEQELIIAAFVYLEDLSDPQFLASEVCDDLIKNHGAPTDRFSSGRYKIFPDVCILLENLVAEEILVFIEKRNAMDRLYSLAI